MTDWMHLLRWYMFIINDMRSCSERTILHYVDSYLYYIFLVNYKNIFWGVNRQYTYIVVNINFIYTNLTSFSCLFRIVKMNYILSDNMRILYLSWYVKAPKKLSNCLKRAETSVVLIVFDCVLGEVRAYKLIIKDIYVPIRRYGDFNTLGCSRRVYRLLNGVKISISTDRNVDNEFIPCYSQN